MKLEDQVCSLELSKRLKELGIKQEGLFYWVKIGLNVNTREENWRIESLTHNLTKIPDYYISALTVSELGHLFPNEFKVCTQFYKSFINGKISSIDLSFHDKIYTGLSEADQRAEILIYLLENNLMEIQK